MINRHTTFFKALNLTVDYILLNLSMVMIYFVEEEVGFFWINKKYLTIVLLFNLIWLLSTNISGLYEHVLNKDSIKTYRSLIKTYLIFVSVIFSTLVLIGPQPYFITRQYVVLSLLLFGFLLGVWKLVFLSIRLSERRQLIHARDIVIVGGGRIGNDLNNYFISHPDHGYRVVGFFDNDPSNISNESLYLGGVDNCIAYVLENRLHEIFCTLPISDSDLITKLMLDADKNLIRFKSVPQYYDYSKKSTIVESFGHIPVLSLRTEPLENLLNRSLKRFFDCVFSLFIIVFVCSWLFPILALLVKLESKGPVFFVQSRSGRGSTPFNCYKFRTMKVHNSHEFVQASRNDQRVTRIGKMLRKTSMDELPQFFNVLIGNMSVVGPRPHPLKLDAEYVDLVNSYMVRHFVKPGVTGWAQVVGLRGETRTTQAMMQRVEADVWYLENWSFLLDFKIIFLTFTNVFRGDQNAF